jgi:hypothetical protein
VIWKTVFDHTKGYHVTKFPDYIIILVSSLYNVFKDSCINFIRFYSHCISHTVKFIRFFNVSLYGFACAVSLYGKIGVI